MSKFYFAGESASISSDDDEDNLPYPEALPRSDFLVHNFDAPTYLSTLSDRHQTLEDLKSDLRERSQSLSKELLDLVNTNYEQFLSLGSDLRGGEEKLEDVRVGLIGFKRGVEDVRYRVTERHREVERLLEEKMHISKQISTARKLLEVDALLEELEERLMVSSLGRNVNGIGEDAWSDSEDEDGDDESVAADNMLGTSTKKLQGLVQNYRQVHHLASTIGQHHPYVISQEPRMARIRNTLLLDLNTALKHAHSVNEASNQGFLKIMALYSEMNEGLEAVKVLKGFK